MGWYYTHGATRRDIIGQIVRDSTNPSMNRSVLRKAFSGNTMWTVETVGEDTFIGCYLLGRTKCNGLMSWGYKPMCEAMHPFYYTCPELFLKLAPVANRTWREKVHAYWDARRGRRRSK